MMFRNLCFIAVSAVTTALMSGIAASAQQPSGAAKIAFRDAVVPAPPHPTTPVFHLSRDYPHSAPEECTHCAWLHVGTSSMFTASFPPATVKSPEWKGTWNKYMESLFEYIIQGQDMMLSNEKGWTTKVDGKTRWFNVPWMAYDPTAGREYVHGATNERTAHLVDIIHNEPHTDDFFLHLGNVSDSCKEANKWGFESWSVGYYNEYGGQAMGRAIPATGVPAMSTFLGAPVPAGLPFQTGTMVIKVLTSSVPLECAPFLKGSPAWQIDRHKLTADKGYLCEREVQISHVVQFDVAVVDPRSPTRWVYGTFVYDSTQTNGYPGAPPDSFWAHMIPLGLQWGSDPWTFPAVPKEASLTLQQSVINPSVKTYQHWGCQDRLAGPVDNPQSSCTSCHMSAYAATPGALTEMGNNAPPSFGFPGLCQAFSAENVSYFQNQGIPQGYPGGLYPNAISMDTSLQLAVAFTQYGLYHTNHEPNACTDPNQGPPVKIEKTKPGRKFVEEDKQ